MEWPWSGVSAPQSHEAVGCGKGTFRLRFHGPDGNQLVARGLRAAIPRFAEIGNASLGPLYTADRRSSETGRRMGRLPDAFERSVARFFLPLRCRSNSLNGFAQSIHSPVGVFPRIDKQPRIKRANPSAHVFQFEHSRAFWDQQTNAELYRRNIFKEGLFLQHVQQV